MANRSEFILNAGQLAPADRADAVRFAVGLVAAEVATFECDVPLSQAAKWLPDVHAAASVLGSLRPAARGEGAAYRRTGVQAVQDETVWRAFVTFAPHAFDASVWDARGRCLVSLADEGTSVVAVLTGDEADLVRSRYGTPFVDALKPRRTGAAALACWRADQ